MKAIKTSQQPTLKAASHVKIGPKGDKIPELSGVPNCKVPLNTSNIELKRNCDIKAVSLLFH